MAETELTRPARALVCQARRLSARLGHGYVGSEHLLLALSTPEGGMAQRILIGAGLTDQAVESALVLLVGRGSPEKAPCQGLTPACRRCIGRAAMEALGRGRPGVEPEHLLLGVLGEGDCMAARVLSGIRLWSGQPEKPAPHRFMPAWQKGTPQSIHRAPCLRRSSSGSGG